MLLVALLNDDGQVRHDGVTHLWVVEPSQLDDLRKQKSHHADDVVGAREHQLFVAQIVDAVFANGNLLLRRGRSPVGLEQLLQGRRRQILAAGALRIFEEVLKSCNIIRVRVVCLKLGGGFFLRLLFGQN